MQWPFQRSNSSKLADAAFEILVREHHRSLIAYAYSLVRSSSIAEDLVQDSFLVAWRKMDQFDPSRDFNAWMRGIIRFEYLHWARKRKESALEPAVLDHLDHLHAQTESARRNGDDVLAVVRSCVAELPEAMREVVNAVYANGLSCVEIANKSDASETAVRKRLQRGREHVETCLAGKLNLVPQS